MREKHLTAKEWLRLRQWYLGRSRLQLRGDYGDDLPRQLQRTAEGTESVFARVQGLSPPIVDAILEDADRRCSLDIGTVYGI